MGNTPRWDICDRNRNPIRHRSLTRPQNPTNVHPTRNSRNSSNPSTKNHHNLRPIHRPPIPHPHPTPMTEKNTTPNNHTDIHTNKWMQQANCKNKTNQMFPKHHKDITYITQARQICANCPVKTECLNYALQYPPADMHGVWAGLTSRQLAAEQHRRQIKPTKPSLSRMWND